MLTNLTFEILAVLLMGAIIAHIALVVASRWLNPLFLIAGAYCVLAPISAAQEFALVGVGKYGRVSLVGKLDKLPEEEKGARQLIWELLGNLLKGR